MLSQNKIKYINSLHQKKYRQLNNCFIVEGEKMVFELLKSNLNTIDLYATADFISINKGIVANEITDKELKKISSLKTPNKVIAIAEIPMQDKTLFVQNELILVLDNIQDPGNLGTIIRTANWFGIKSIICSPDTVDAYNSKVIQSTMGAIFRTQIIYTNLPTFLLNAKGNGTLIYGTVLDGTNLHQTELLNHGLVVLGNESKGISDEIKDLIDVKIRIPDFPFGKSGMESLNVGIANAIVLAEFRRQQLC